MESVTKGNITLKSNESLASFHNVCINTHINSRDVISALRADGWFEVNHEGSHKQFKHSTKTGRVTVVHPSRDIPGGTLRSIEKQSGLKLR